VTDSRSHAGVRFRRRVCRICANGYFTAEQVIDNSMFAVICEGEDFRTLTDD
jgi:transcriptional regulator NrdR family protein